MVKVGERAPDFTLEDGDKHKFSLSQFRGKNVLLAFFPFAFSPVCTDEMACFESDLPHLKGLDVQILGISVDSTWSQKAFAKSLRLDFPLLSDFTKDVCRKYGMLREDGFSNRAYVLVDKSGVVQYAHAMPTPGEKLNNELLIEKIKSL